MKTLTLFLKNHLPLAVVMGAFLLIFGAAKMAYSGNNGPVKVKIVKIVDGDTTVIEKTMDETGVKDFTRHFENIKGKNVQVQVTIEDDRRESREKNEKAPSMHFNFNMDSTMARSFAKCFSYDGGPNDSSGSARFCKKFMWNDSLLKHMPEGFDLKFDFDDKDNFDFDFNINTENDGKTVIIKNGSGRTVVINGNDEVTESRSESGNGKTKTKTIVINDKEGNAEKKVIVSTSVVVIDMDDKKAKSRREKEANKEQADEKRESGFSFFPNPTDGNFILELDLNENEDAHVKITDVAGKEIYNEKLTGNGHVRKMINLSGKKGTFIVTIKQGKKVTSKKIIIG